MKFGKGRGGMEPWNVTRNDRGPITKTLLQAQKIKRLALGDSQPARLADCQG